MAAIEYEKRNRIAYVTINRPEKMNALGPELNDEIIRVWTDFRDDPEVWVAILTGAGDKAFSAGADLKTYTPLHGQRGAYAERQEANLAGFGGITRGLELALACGIRVASENAQFACSEVRRGFHHCDGGTVRLPLIVGLGNALRMQLTGEPIDAREALRIGLVSDVVETKDLMPTAERYASLVLRNGPLGVRSAKESMLRSLGRAMEDALRLEHLLVSSLTGTEDFVEGPRAFAEKREPAWKER